MKNVSDIQQYIIKVFGTVWTGYSWSTELADAKLYDSFTVGAALLRAQRSASGAYSVIVYTKGV